MDLRAGRRVSYNIDSLLGPSASNSDADDDRRPVTCNRNSWAAFAPGNALPILLTIQSQSQSIYQKHITNKRMRTVECGYLQYRINGVFDVFLIALSARLCSMCNDALTR